MRRYALAFLYILGCLAIALPFIGCESPIDVNGKALLPASQADVAVLRTDHDAAIQSARIDADNAIGALRAEKNADLTALRTDIETIKSTGQKAYEESLKSGGTIADAMNARFAAEKLEATNRLNDALAKAKTDTDAALADTRAKAETASATATKAGKDAENSTSPTTVIVGGLSVLLTALGLGKWVSGLQAAAKVAQAIAGYDAAPFIGANGEKVSESQLVSAAIPKTGSSTS